MMKSPDSIIECLNELIDYQRSHEYFSEEIQALLLQASIVTEFLCAQKKMDISYLNINRGSDLFINICPACSQFICQEGHDFILKSYCDSPMFSEHSLICHLLFIIERCKETNNQEIGYLLIDLIWPILEHRHVYSLLRKTFLNFSDYYEKASNVPQNQYYNNGNYFNVNFYGSIFKEENGKMFIYREKKMIHLNELQNRLIKYYSKFCNPAMIEIINENENTDILKFNKNRGYIQIISVKPLFLKDKSNNDVTDFDRNFACKSFYYDIMLAKDISGGQIQRNILTIGQSMPFIVKRIEVVSKEKKDFTGLD